MTNKYSDVSSDSKYQQLLERALSSIKKLKQENANLKNDQISISAIGLACRMPLGGDCNLTFWKNLISKRDCATSPQADRWSLPSDEKSSYLNKEASFIGDVYRFDAEFFNIPAAQAVSMDPQHRLLLETTWQALEDAGYDPSSLRGKKVGVFLGIMNQDYFQKTVQNDSAISALTPLGHSMGVAAGRIAHSFDFVGPTIGLDTNCSSSLVAINIAEKSLQGFECDIAVVGAVNLMLSPSMTDIMDRASALSADGRCKSFDDSADGYGRGEGCLVTVLQRTDDATADKRDILANILSSVVQHDGASSGLSVPNGLAQQRLIQQALDQASLSKEDIDYVEAHGTGTSLGDPIELDALQEVFRGRKKPLLLGTVKSNVGHLEAAAGLAGFAKVLLGLKNNTLPANIHFNDPTSRFDWQNSCLQVIKENQPWEHESNYRRAGISSFGFGGTIAHVIVEEAPVRERDTAASAREQGVLCLSAKTPAALTGLVEKYQHWLASEPDVTVGDVCYTAAVGRSHFTHRLAVTGNSLAALKGALESVSVPETSYDSPSVAWLFSGQGAQYAGMGQGLYQDEAVFREAMDQCAQLLEQELDVPLTDLLWGASNERLSETRYTQPALFALEYSLAMLWQSWGHTPALLMGHSVGEYAAACVAGVFSLADGLRLIAARGRLMDELTSPGRMVVLFADASRVESLLDSLKAELVASPVAIAAYNGPQNVVVSGGSDGIARVLAEAAELGMNSHELSVSRAFHSPLMAPMLSAFREVAASVTYHAPGIRLVSNVTGREEVERFTEVDYWVSHIEAPVAFAKGMDALSASGVEVYVELGPDQTLVGMGRGCGIEAASWLPSLLSDDADTETLAGAVAGLYAVGHGLDWSRYYAGRDHLRVHVPTYAFNGEEYRLSEQEPLWSTARTLTAQTNNKKTLPIQTLEWVQEEYINSKSDNSHILIVSVANNSFAERMASELVSMNQKFDTFTLTPSAETLHSDVGLQECIQKIKNSRVHVVAVVGASTEPNATELNFESMKIHLNTLVSVANSLNSHDNAKQLSLSVVAVGYNPIQPQSSDINNTAILGLAKTLGHEFSESFNSFYGVSVSFRDTELQQVINGIIAEKYEISVFSEDKKYCQRLIPFDNAELNTISGTASMDKNGAYIVTGGLGSLGYAFATWLAERDVGKLYLLGRSELDPEKQKKINALNQLADTEYLAIDISDRTQLEGMFDNINLPLKGIIHSAGSLHDGVLANVTPEDFYSVFPAKVVGAWNLHQLSQQCELDFFVMFSSVAATFGSAGQANYASANNALEFISQLRHSLKKPSLTIHWGAWEIGMVDKLNKIEKDRLNDNGIEFIDTQSAIACFSDMLNFPTTPVVNLAKLDLQKYVSNCHASFVSSMINLTYQEKNIVKSDNENPLAGLSDDQIGLYVKDKLTNIFAKKVGKPHETIEQTEDLTTLGIDSLVIIDIASAIQKEFQISFFPRDIYANKSIEKLSKIVINEVTYDPLTEVKNKPIDFNIEGIRISDESIFDEVEKKLKNGAFLLSSPRAGSTLLRAMLAGHSRLFSPPELHLLPYYDMAQRQSELEPSLQGGLQRTFMELYNMDADESRQHLDDLLKSKKTIWDIYNELVSMIGDRLLIDKSPTYAVNKKILERAENIFEKPKYIHLIRHPYAVIDSFVRIRMEKFASILSSGNEESPYATAEKSWTLSNKNIREFVQENNLEDRYHLIRYEDLISNPIDTLFQLCEFLELDFEQSLLNPFSPGRMTEGVYENTLSVGDPNFNTRSKVESRLGDVWKDINLPSALDLNTYRLAIEAGYQCEKEDNIYQGADKPVQKMHEHTFLCNGIEHAICCWGNPENEAVLIVHGILDQGLAWEKVAQELCQRGYYVIAPDLRGHGKSNWNESLHMMDFLNDIHQIIDNFIGKPVSVIGHSFGGYVSLAYLSLNSGRVKKLSCVECYFPDEQERDQVRNDIREMIVKERDFTQVSKFDSISAVANRLIAANKSLDLAFATKLAQRCTLLNSQGSYQWAWNPRLEYRNISTAPFDSNYLLESLDSNDVPIDFVFSHESSTCNKFSPVFSRLAKTYNQTMLEGDHNIHFSNPQALVRFLLDNFLVEKNRPELSFEK